MDRVFEDEFMEAQSRIVALCVEFAGNRADKVYAYGSIEESSISFNAFFNIDGQIKTTNNIAAGRDMGFSGSWRIRSGEDKTNMHTLRKTCPHRIKNNL